MTKASSSPAFSGPTMSLNVSRPIRQQAKSNASNRGVGRLAWIMSRSSYEFGFMLAGEIINFEDLSLLNKYIDDSNSSDVELKSRGLSVLVGVTTCFAMALLDLRDSGKVKFAGARITTVGEIVYDIEGDVVRVFDILNVQVSVIQKLFDQKRGWRVTFANVKKDN